MELDKNEIYYVYAWYFIDNGEIFYIGKGKNERFKSLNRRNNFFKNIIKKYKDNIDIKIIEKNLSEFNAFELEKKLIKEYKEKGQCIANFHEGGRGGNTGNYDNVERSKKLSEAAKKRVGELNPMYGKTHTDEVKEKLREINLGKKLSEEHKQKLIKANTNRKKTKEEIEKLRIAKLGHKMKEESYKLMMDNLCPYEYQVYDSDKMIFSCLGHTRLYDFCKNELKCSRSIVDKIKNCKWKPKFKKHMHLKNITIKIINRHVSTKGDECNLVE